MRILITGATGFVGGWLAAELARAYPDAVLIGTTHQAFAAGLPDDLPPTLRLVECDIREQSEVRALIEDARPDRVFHLAGFASAAGGDEAAVRAVNVEATAGLLRALAELGQEVRVLLASSGYVYGDTSSRPAAEDDPVAPKGAYALSKAEMEQVAQRSAASDGLSLTVTRAFNHTGPRQTDAFVVPAFARQIARIERALEPPVVRVGNLSARRDFLHVRDVVRAYRLLLELHPVPWRVVNVASGQGVEIRSILEQLISCSATRVAVEPDPARMRPSDLPESVGDPSLLSRLTGWAPERSLGETLAETLEWWRTRTG